MPRHGISQRVEGERVETAREESKREEANRVARYVAD